MTTTGTTTEPTPAAPETPARARGPYLVAGIVTVVLLAVSTRYGPHRDELYFVAAGHHLQWGYPDQPLLTPLIAVTADLIAPGSLLALRFVPALIIGAVVLFNADLTRELGGQRRAQMLTAVTIATGVGMLGVGHLLVTATVDLLAWTVVIWLVVRILHRDTPRQWLLVGLAAGLGLENKSLVAPLVAALLLGVLIMPTLRHHLRSPWLYLGGAIAGLLWIPDLWWQAAHGWPQFELAGDIRDEYGNLGGVAQFVVLQVFLLGFLGMVLAAVGFVALFRRPEWRYARPIAVAYLVLTVLFLATGGKGYYLLGLLGPLAAAGSVVLAQRWSATGVTVLTVVIGLVALFPVPALLPVLPMKTYAGSFYPAMNEDELETIGWPRVVAQVRAVAAELPAQQRKSAVVVTLNYGEAGALLWYGGTPPVYSGHNGFGDWGPPSSPGPVLYVGEHAPRADALTGCRQAATLHTGVDNEEDGHGVWICTGPAGSWSSAWPRLRHLDA